MNYLVTITKQNQISIPVELVRLYGLADTRKALVYPDQERKRIIIQPVEDFMSLKGVLKGKKINFRKARQEFEEYLAARHLK
ncbi:MAG: AbrB/MazE/SpoVT family DNA-binding domain-containing protein [Patescibacteria group bacterium]|nr:AbrB/MazE/SpoVT family DNA-binding domain-containing protein [Patescibacteria group bacterium]